MRFIAVLASLLIILSAGNISGLASIEPEEMTVGALVTTTGDWASVGKCAEAALCLAEVDANELLEKWDLKSASH